MYYTFQKAGRKDFESCHHEEITNVFMYHLKNKFKNKKKLVFPKVGQL
jgi:hypothetical protein